MILKRVEALGKFHFLCTPAVAQKQNPDQINHSFQVSSDIIAHRAGECHRGFSVVRCFWGGGVVDW